MYNIRTCTVYVVHLANIKFGKLEELLFWQTSIWQIAQGLC